MKTAALLVLLAAIAAEAEPVYKVREGVDTGYFLCKADPKDIEGGHCTVVDLDFDTLGDNVKGAKIEFPGIGEMTRQKKVNGAAGQTTVHYTNDEGAWFHLDFLKAEGAKSMFAFGEMAYNGKGDNYGELETDLEGNTVLIHWKHFVVDE